MTALKRGRQHFEQSEDDSLTILVSDEHKLVVQASLVRICSFCAAGLPAEAAEWDLRLLRMDGEPVDLATVIGWLNCVYERLQDEPFMQQDRDVRHTVAGLTRLLAFADAVGTTRGVMAACVTQLAELHMKVEIPASHRSVNMTVETDGRVYLFAGENPYYWDAYDDFRPRELACATPSRDVRPVAGISSTISQQRVFKQRVAQQIEPLLHLAHKLELRPLINHLHTFISSSTIKDSCILWGVLEAVFTDRVLNTVLSEHASEKAKSAWIDSVLSARCGCAADSGLGSLLRPVSRSRTPERVAFEAQLCAPLLGSQAGDRVQVSLDLFGDSHHQAWLTDGPSRAADRSQPG